ncbi:MAG: VOC family protein [Paracoccaceae bacterium]
MLVAMDHVNIRTPNLDKMVAWYGDILGMPTGKRPTFPFPGAWLYLGDQAYVHLVGVDQEMVTGADIALEHFAFRAKGLKEFVEKLNAADITHSLDRVPGFPVVQVNLHDPDGNHIHVDFDVAEMADMDRSGAA